MRLVRRRNERTMKLSVLESAVPPGIRGYPRPGLLHLPDGSDAGVEDALYLLGEWEFGYDDAQQFTVACALREQADGRWAAKEFGVEEPRQNGKGEIIEGRECLGLFYYDERKLIHSAHEFATASEALDRMDDRIGRNPQLKRRVKSVKRSHGEEGIYLYDGRSLRYKTRTKGGGRGFSADLLILDEAMYIAEAFLGALMPVISARPNPQMWYTGSAVDREHMEHGIVFSRLRQSALEGKAGRVAYLGWSAAYEDNEVRWKTPADVARYETENPDLIARANPALGVRIDLDHIIDSELRAMDHRTFCVERLGIGDWPDPDAANGERVIDPYVWATLEDTGSSIVGTPAFAVDTTPDRSASTISTAGFRVDGKPHVETVDGRRGTGWVVARVGELLDRHGAREVWLDESGPAGSLVVDFENEGIAVHSVTAREHAQACGAFYDVVDSRELRHLGTPDLLAAVRGAVKRPLGEAWAWNRKHSGVDISPLVAATLALQAARADRRDVVPLAAWA